MADEVESYTSMALRWWAARIAPHGETCPCLPCADCRAYLGKPPVLQPIPRTVKRAS